MTEFHFVTHAKIPAFQAQGWVISHDLQDCHHGVYAVLMKREHNHPPGPVVGHVWKKREGA